MDRAPYFHGSRRHGLDAPPRAESPERLDAPYYERSRAFGSPSSANLPSMRSDVAPSFDHNRLPPLQDPHAPPLRSMQRPYPPYGENAQYDTIRASGPSAYHPAGLVGHGYSSNRRSPPSDVHSGYQSVHHYARPHEPHSYDRVPHYNQLRRPLQPSFDGHSSHPQGAHEADVRGTAPVKRPRVSLACLACRNRKSRCDGVRPTCKTCAHMKIDCKWPEVDFRRAKTGEAARQRRKSSGGPSSEQRSPEVQAARPYSSQMSPLNADETARRPYTDGGIRAADLPPSQSMPLLSRPYTGRPHTSGLTDSPPASYRNNYQLKEEAVHPAEGYTKTFDSVSVPRSPSDRYLSGHRPEEDRGELLARKSWDMRGESLASHSKKGDSSRIFRADNPDMSPRDRRRSSSTAHVAAYMQTDVKTSASNMIATRCRVRAAQIAVLARPSNDAMKKIVESQLLRETTLEDLVGEPDARDRLSRAYSLKWDSFGRQASAHERTFMEAMSGNLAIIELQPQAESATPKDPLYSTRLHIFRLKNSVDSLPDLRHCDIAMDLSVADQKALAQSSTTFDTLLYPVPVGRLPCSVLDSVQRALTDRKPTAEGHADPQTSARAPLHAVSVAHERVPFAASSDVKPPRAVTETFFHAFVDEIGEQMPGLEPAMILARIRNDSISSLLANALCCIGASLYERADQRPRIPDALSSGAYLERARALIGSALCKDDLETILSLGVMGIRDLLMGLQTSAATIIASAMRMCIQLDLHRASSRPKAAPSTDNFDEATIFWMIYCLDRIAALGTARPVTIRDQDIDAPFPPTLIAGEPSIFSALVRQLHYAGRLAELSVASDVHAAARLSQKDRERAHMHEMELASIEDDLIGHYESLPSSLRLSGGNLRKAADLGQPLSFLQLHLSHKSSLILRYLLSATPMTDAEHDTLRTAAREIGEICVLSEAFDGKSMSESPLSASALFLAGCVSLSEVEYLRSLDESTAESRPGLGSSSSPNSARNVKLQLDAAQSNLSRVTETLERQAQYWPAARSRLEILHKQASVGKKSPFVSNETIQTLVSQVEAVQILVRPSRNQQGHGGDDFKSEPAEAERSADVVRVRKVADYEQLHLLFPHMFR